MRLLAHSIAILLLACTVLLGECGGSNSAVSPSGVSAGDIGADDQFAGDDALDYLTAADSEGQTIVSDDYFDDDDYLNDYSTQRIILDPLEPWNRFWFGFNDIFLEYVGRPVSKGYNVVVPTPAREGIKNFFHNLGAPVRIANSLFQGKGQKAGVEFSSFFLNTIAGFGGVLDIASQYEPIVPATDEDLGQTLGVWGLGEGIYLVWPLLGPSNVRDTVGMVGDYAIAYYTNPIKYMNDDFGLTTELALSALNIANSLGDILTAYDTFKDIAVDPYSSMRDGMTQLRRSAIAK